jgi:geranylgeranyl transferase type-2 subunit beta
MLYTVSAVQVLVTLDAVEELEKAGRGGKDKVGSCTVLFLVLQSLC